MSKVERMLCKPKSYTKHPLSQHSYRMYVGVYNEIGGV